MVKSNLKVALVGLGAMLCTGCFALTNKATFSVPVAIEMQDHDKLLENRKVNIVGYVHMDLDDIAITDRSTTSIRQTLLAKAKAKFGAVDAVASLSFYGEVTYVAGLETPQPTGSNTYVEAAAIRYMD